MVIIIPSVHVHTHLVLVSLVGVKLAPRRVFMVTVDFEFTINQGLDRTRVIITSVSALQRLDFRPSILSLHRNVAVQLPECGHPSPHCTISKVKNNTKIQ